MSAVHQVLRCTSAGVYPGSDAQSPATPRHEGSGASLGQRALSGALPMPREGNGGPCAASARWRALTTAAEPPRDADVGALAQGLQPVPPRHGQDTAATGRGAGTQRIPLAPPQWDASAASAARECDSCWSCGTASAAKLASVAAARAAAGPARARQRRRRGTGAAPPQGQAEAARPKEPKEKPPTAAEAAVNATCRTCGQPQLTDVAPLMYLLLTL